MEKILKPYTIIPPHLYVKRDADRQLREIITDMGRPGYVLVSRQMGKTNLLLNAKRELSNQDDIFIYIDLSNTFDNETACFQNIINTAIEINSELYSEISTIIQKQRQERNDLPPHKQHERELRYLLKATKGKLVVILDEIDALTKTSYSDKIFAQIRSVYFSRVNFPEFEKLTYILSGVVEPSEIIKDPKISPFNIGEKIFLNDFSKEEFDEFIKKAKLDELKKEFIERIFYWTNGNPRITWDLCSMIENNKFNIQSIDTIDEFVQKLYLTSFDKPPIDNIREMVIADKAIRDAIIEIDYNKGKEVADNIKSKLYLAGIINFEENDIKIKNRIIKNSLSRTWIESVKLQEQGLLSLAIENIEKENYKEAIIMLDKFLKNSESLDKETENFAFYNFGLAFYNVSEFENAIEQFSKTNFSSKSYPQIFYRIKKLIGICFLALNKPDESISFFKYVVENDQKDEHYAYSLLNYGVAYSKLKGKENIEIAINTFLKITSENNFEEMSMSQIENVKAMANYNLGYLKKNVNLKESIEYFKSALLLSSQDLKPSIYQSLISNEENKNQKLIYLHDCIENIIEFSLKPISNDVENSNIFNWKLFTDLFINAFEIDIYEFERLLEYSKEIIYLDKNNDEILHIIATNCLNNNKWEIGNSILKYSHAKKFFSKDSIFSYSSLKLLAYINKFDKKPEYSIEYLNQFRNGRLEPIDFYDFDIVSHTTFFLTSKGKFVEAKEYLQLLFPLKNDVKEDLLINYILLKHLDLQIEISIGDNLKIMEIAKDILNEIESNKYENVRSNLLGDKGLLDIKIFAQNIVNPNPSKVPIKVEKIYGRNDKIKVRFNDGRIVEKKYKHLEKDLLEKNCKII